MTYRNIVRQVSLVKNKPEFMCLKIETKILTNYYNYQLCITQSKIYYYKSEATTDLLNKNHVGTKEK